jgi:DHA1 family bicyclomycin/chloramphenicol resistance-like MFS transporter
LTILLGVLVALTPLGTDMFLPALPTLAAAFDAPVAATQLTLTTFFLGIAVGQLTWGPLSDRYGRKPVLLAGLGLGLLAVGAGLFASSVHEVVLVRLVQGLGFSSGPVVARAMVRDLYSHDLAARLLSRMTMVFSIVPIAAPLAGAAIVGQWGWQAVFWVFAGLTLLVIAACAALSETAPAERRSIHPAKLLATFTEILGERRFLAPFAVLLCVQVGILSFVSGSAFTLIRGFGVSAATYGALFATVMLGQIAGSWFSSRLVLRVGLGGMLRMGTALTMLGGLAAALAAWSGATHWASVVAPFMLYMAGAALTLPSAQAAALTPFPRTAGAVSSLLGAAAFALGAMISAALGAAFDGTARPMASVAALGGIGAFLFERWLARPVLQWKA